MGSCDCEGLKDCTLFESDRSLRAFAAAFWRFSEVSAPAKEETLADGLIIARGSEVEACCDLLPTAELCRSPSGDTPVVAVGLLLLLLCCGDRCK